MRASTSSAAQLFAFLLVLLASSVLEVQALTSAEWRRRSIYQVSPVLVQLRRQQLGMLGGWRGLGGGEEAVVSASFGQSDVLGERSCSTVRCDNIDRCEGAREGSRKLSVEGWEEPEGGKESRARELGLKSFDEGRM